MAPGGSARPELGWQPDLPTLGLPKPLRSRPPPRKRPIRASARRCFAGGRRATWGSQGPLWKRRGNRISGGLRAGGNRRRAERGFPPCLASGIEDRMGYKRHTEYHPAGTWQSKPEISYIPAGHERRDGHSARLRKRTSPDASFGEGYRVLGGASTSNRCRYRAVRDTIVSSGRAHYYRQIS